MEACRKIFNEPKGVNAFIRRKGQMRLYYTKGLFALGKLISSNRGRKSPLRYTTDEPFLASVSRD
jgi:hypothetical protein